MASRQTSLTHTNMVNKATGQVAQKWIGNTYPIKDTVFAPLRDKNLAVFRQGNWYTWVDSPGVTAVYAAFREQVLNAKPSDRQIDAYMALYEAGWVDDEPSREFFGKHTYATLSSIIGDGRAKAGIFGAGNGASTTDPLAGFEAA